MIDRLLLISTCGTSVLTNGAAPEDSQWFRAVANEPEVDRARLDPLVADRRARLEAADVSTHRKMSAELNGIHAVLDKWKPKQAMHLLICTDTALGRATAGLVEGCLPQGTLIESAAGLRTDKLTSFRSALAELTKTLDHTIQDYHDAGWFVVFNLTGGFKSLNGYLQTLGMILADRCVFLFESSTELMEIPRLPVRMTELEELRAHLTLFRRIAIGDFPTSSQAANVPESLILDEDGLVITSPLGELVWGRYRHVLLGEQLLEPLSPKVRLSDTLRKDFGALEAGRKRQVNEVIDAFSAYIDGRSPLLKSQTFKKLEGNPVSGSTHELYAWSDGATGRLFGHYESNGVFVFDTLKNHL